MSVYFSLPSFARAKQHKDDLEKTNPQTPVLKDEDEQFLEKEIFKRPPPKDVVESDPIKIADDGEERKASAKEQEDAGADADQVAIPETQPDGTDGAGDDAGASSPSSEQKSKKSKMIELPSQEEAEKATQGWDAYTAEQKANQSSNETRTTWTSFLPSMKTSAKQSPSEQKDDTHEKPTSPVQADGSRTWAQYASSYVPSSMPSLPDSWVPKFASKDKDSQAEPVYNEDGIIDEEKTKEKQEREVSILLDKLDLSSINNRVFALSNETQKIYERFAQVLKDTMNGALTAYEDMEKLMKEAGPQLEKQFQAMPPFVQTLVKSLPAKLAPVLAPLAASTEKPGDDMKINAKTASSGSTTSTTAKKSSAKKKRRIPGLKGLIGQEGAIAVMLRNVVSFLKVRFPLLASGTNVVMSLAVFILMFVFWYCHKRGKEVRLAKAAEAEKAEGDGEDDDIEDTDDEDDDDKDDEKEGAARGDLAQGLAQATLDQPEPSQVPLPGNDTDKV